MTQPEPGRWTGPTLLAGLGVAALGAALAAVPYKPFELDRFFVPKELALHLGALVMAVAVTARRGARAWSRLDVALAAWLLLSVVSLFGATSIAHAWRALGITASGAAIFWAADALRDAKRERGVVRVLAGAAALASLTALAQAYGFTSDLFSLSRAPGGMLGNRNFVAHVAAITLPAIVWLTATARSSPRALLGAAAVFIAAAALVLSRTRAAWLAILIWLALAVPLIWRGRAVIVAAMPPGRWKLLVGAIAAGVVIAVALPNTLDWRSDSPYLDSVRGVVNYREGSGAGRLRQYQNSFKMARANPVLGVGPGNWAAEYPAFAARNDPSLVDATGMTANPWPSSDWVAALSERGIPAAIALTTFVLLLLRNAWRGWSDSVFSSRERFGALAGGSVVLIGSIEGLFDAVTLLALPAVLVWGAAGALIPPGKPAFTYTPGDRTRRNGVLLAGLVWVALVLTSAAKVQAMRLFTRGSYDSIRSAAAWDPESYRIQYRAAEIQADRGYCRLAYHNARRAVSLFPHSMQAQRLVARCASAPPP